MIMNEKEIQKLWEMKGWEKYPGKVRSGIEKWYNVLICASALVRRNSEGDIEELKVFPTF